MRSTLQNWFSNTRKEAAKPETDREHLELARESLQELLQDKRVPESLRESMMSEYRQVQGMLDKLQNGHLHIAVFGRVSVGKSATLNALLGNDRFRTSPLHGETRQVDDAHWQEYREGKVILMDTPGIDEVDGEDRERVAVNAASRADLVLFVVDGDLTDSEHTALQQIVARQRPVVLVLNKVDQYTATERQQLLSKLREHARSLVDPEHVVAIAAQPRPQTIIRIDEHGNEQETVRERLPEIAALRDLMWRILEREGKTLVALNAALFAGELSDEVSSRIMQARREIAAKVIHAYCLAKGIAVGLNPIPVADLLAAASIDVTMIVHLSKLYGLEMTKVDASKLVMTIIAQMGLLMGSVWAMNFVSSVFKGISSGWSAVLTGGAQGAVAWYSTRVVGEVAENYLRNGMSWGESGPKQVVSRILGELDRDSILSGAQEEIMARLKKTKEISG